MSSFRAGSSKGWGLQGLTGLWAPIPVTAGGTQGELALPSQDPCPQGHHLPPPPVQAERLCLSHQVQVIHVAAVPGLPVGTSAHPGYHDNRMRGTRASVGCGSLRGSAIDGGGGLFLPPVGSLARAGAAGGWAAPPCLVPWHFLPAICAGAGGRAGVPPWWEGLGHSLLGRTALPAGFSPHPSSKDPSRGCVTPQSSSSWDKEEVQDSVQPEN